MLAENEKLYRNRRLPAIDYRSHPAYGRAFGSPPLKVRLAALKRLAPTWAYFLARDIYFLAKKGDASALEGVNSELWAKMDERGALAYSLKDSNPDGYARVEAALAAPVAELRRRRTAIGDGKRTYDENQMVLSKEAHAGVFEALQAQMSAAGLIGVASKRVGKPTRIEGITLQINDETDAYWKVRFADVGLNNPRSHYMHVDTTRPAVKGILYLNDVAPEGGAFSYVLGSHKIRRGFLEQVTRSANDKSGLSQCDPNLRRLFLALPKPLQHKADFGNDLLDDTEEAKRILECEHLFAEPAGTVVLFDNFGIHRGGMVEKGERAILQILLS